MRSTFVTADTEWRVWCHVVALYVQAEKARCNVWQWLSLDQSLIMPDGSSAVVDAKLLNQAFDEVRQLIWSIHVRVGNRLTLSV